MQTSIFPSYRPGAEPGSDQYGINLMNMYMVPLQEKMDVKEVAPFLAEAGLLTLVDIVDIEERACHRKTAVVHLMKKLVKSRDPNWFTKFKMALKKSGQQIIYRLMSEENVPDEEGYEKILLSNFVFLTEDINPIPLLPVLFQRGTIVKSDMDEIIRKANNEGNKTATMRLLTIIPRRKNGWFTDFIAALKKENCRNILELFGPKFLDAKSDESIDRYAIECIKVKQQVTPTMNQNISKQMDPKEAKKSSVAVIPELKDATANVNALSKVRKTDELGKNRYNVIPEERHVLAQGDNTASKSAGTLGNFQSSANAALAKVDSQLENSPMQFDIREDHEPTDSSLCEENVPSTSESISRWLERASTGSASAKSAGTLNAEMCSVTHGKKVGSGLMCEREISTLTMDLNLRSDFRSVPARGELTSALTNQLSQAPQGSQGPNILPSLSASANIFDSVATEVDESLEEVVTKQTLKLRDYQLELAEMAVDGKNCIIVAPTGSGKTYVALHISKLHLNCIEGERKVLFFIPKVALVMQQKRQYMTYLDENWKVASVCGDSDMQMTLPNIIKNNDVIVLTPQILVNAIEEGEMDDPFSQITLMIFDECHHAMKDHPYNRIMSKYNDILLSNDADKIHHLPQIVGLTASPGVGKAVSDEAAVNHILMLCANLASSGICTVTKKENLEELQKSVNVPVEGIEDVQGRVNDPFRVAVDGIMAEIENRMKSRKDLQALATEVPNIAKVLEPPAQRGHESYTQFLAHLKREIAKVYSQEIRRFFLSCQEHLEVYNNALLINADCRTIDAVEHVKSWFNDRNSGGKCKSLTSDEADLDQLYAWNIVSLERMSRTKEAENPKLKYLEGLILGFYKVNPQSQGIIFCKTRFMTTALVKWIEETETLKSLEPYHMVGSGSTAAKSSVSMTHRKLEDVLKYFKDGRHKIIVATSVAEEGLDVKSCNYVIRYEHVTNDIARVQSRGRARAVDAKFVVVGERGGGVRQREATNQVREDLMCKAIFLIRRLSDDEFEMLVREHQRNAKQEREVAAVAKLNEAKFRKMTSHEDDYQLRCFKCDNLGVWSSDLRTIKESHHVVLDQDFRDRIRVEDHPKPIKYDNFEKKGKVHCKKCDYDWGIMALYKKVPVYLLKVCSFAVQDQDGSRNAYKKWKEVPFQVNELTPEDMKSLVSMFSESSI